MEKAIKIQDNLSEEEELRLAQDLLSLCPSEPSPSDSPNKDDEKGENAKKREKS